MTTIHLENTGKRFRLDWIFKGVSFTFRSGTRYAILGPNGSGKSTLLKVLSGHLTPSKGKVSFKKGEKTVDPDLVYQMVGYAGPYIELIEEFTLEEAFDFHAALRPLLPGINKDLFFEILALPKARHKEIRNFSSGMKQRLKLALAICSDTPILLLDEPATNLDVQGVEWYKNLVSGYAGNRLVIIASNDPHDADFCPEHVNILDYK
jgi:ABC-type multidrug transport system ATPase subunit